MTTSGDSKFPVTVTSPCMSVHEGITRSGMLGYGWTPADPFVVTCRIAISNNSISVDADMFPGGLSCGSCRGQIAWGGFACDAGDKRIICLPCGQQFRKLNVQIETWVIGLPLFVNLLDGEDDVAHMPGEVQMYRAANGELNMVLSNRDNKHSIRIVAPWSNMKTFLADLTAYRETLKEPVETQYLNSGVDSLEKLANDVK